MLMEMMGIFSNVLSMDLKPVKYWNDQEPKGTVTDN